MEALIISWDNVKSSPPMTDLEMFGHARFSMSDTIGCTVDRYIKLLEFEESHDLVSLVDSLGLSVSDLYEISGTTAEMYYDGGFKAMLRKEYESNGRNITRQYKSVLNALHELRKI